MIKIFRCEMDSPSRIEEFWNDHHYITVYSYLKRSVYSTVEKEDTENIEKNDELCEFFNGSSRE